MTSAVATCTVYRAYFKHSKTPPCETMHLFTKTGFAERDMCPYIMKTTQSRRAAFLAHDGICTVCLIDRQHLPKDCPDVERFGIYRCAEPTCFNRKTTCPNPAQHMNISPNQVDPRMETAIKAGILITYINMTIGERDMVKELQEDLSDDLSVSLLGDVISEEDIPLPMSTMGASPMNPFFSKDEKELKTRVDAKIPDSKL